MPLVITETRKNRDVALGGVQVIQSAGPLVEAAQEQKDLWESAPKQERPKSDAAILKEGRRAWDVEHDYKPDDLGDGGLQL